VLNLHEGRVDVVREGDNLDEIYVAINFIPISEMLKFEPSDEQVGSKTVIILGFQPSIVFPRAFLFPKISLNSNSF